MSDVPAAASRLVPGVGRFSPVTALSLFLVGATLFGAAFADLAAPYDPNYQNYAHFLQPPSWDHWLGTDHLGRDILSRLMHGSRVALAVGLAAVGFAMTVGTATGLAAGYIGGLLDEAVMRVVDAIMAFPSIMLALGITAALGPSLTTIIIAIGIGETPLFARLARGQVLSIRERDFVTAAITIGARPGRVILWHILPHILSPIFALATVQIGIAILTEAGLSFLGLGVQPPTPSWGGMLKSGFNYMEVAPWISFFSGLAIFLSVLGVVLLGDAVRARQDPRAV